MQPRLLPWVREFDDRAIRALQKSCERAGVRFDQPTKPDTYIDDATARRYVVLYNCNYVLGVYRILQTERLRLLKRRPRALTALYGCP